MTNPFRGEEPAYLGKKGVQAFGGLDVFPNPGNSIVRMTSDEVTSLCPITGQPDFEVVDITYAPREQCIESKSLKLYFASLRDEGAFVEQLAVDTAHEVAKACEPEWVRVDVTQKSRGGISIVAVALLHRTADGMYVPAPLTFIEAPRNYYLGH